MSASSLLLKSAERFHKARSVTLAMAQVWWSEITTICRGPLRRLFDSYKPEVYYMRGPGPKSRKKHRLAANEIKARKE